MRYLVEGGPVTHIYPWSKIDAAMTCARRSSRFTEDEVLVSRHDKYGNPKICPVAVYQGGEMVWEEDE